MKNDYTVNGGATTENLDNKKRKYTASQAPIVSCVYANDVCPSRIGSVKELIVSYYERRHGLA
jgi:hypothetical protein